MNERGREMLPLVAWVAALVAAVVAFTAMGSGQLAGPALTDPGSWSDWAAGRDPAVATAAVLRLVVLVLAWYLLGVTAVGAVARVADALSLPVVRRVLQTSLGVGLATAVAVSPVTDSHTGPNPVMATAAQEVEVPAPPRMRPLPPRQAATPDHPPGSTPDDRQTPTPDDPQNSPPDDPRDPTPEDHHAPMPASDTTDPTTVTVRPGDHLWSIAERHLAARGDRAPTDDEVAVHWRRFIDANRDRLVDPANPDLILPGQQFVLPEATDGERGRT